MENKIKALAQFLDVDTDDIENNDGMYFEADGAEYKVLTDEEADEALHEYIKENVWSFNASFLAGFTELPEEVFTALQPQCESANDAILSLIERSEGGFGAFVEEAERADGRGLFLSGYDGAEEMETVDDMDYYIYRTN